MGREIVHQAFTSAGDDITFYSDGTYEISDPTEDLTVKCLWKIDGEGLWVGNYGDGGNWIKIEGEEELTIAKDLIDKVLTENLEKAIWEDNG